MATLIKPELIKRKLISSRMAFFIERLFMHGYSRSGVDPSYTSRGFWTLGVFGQQQETHTHRAEMRGYKMTHCATQRLDSNSQPEL